MNDSIAQLMQRIGADAKAAAEVLASASTDAKNAALTAGGASLRAAKAELMAANAKDLEAGPGKGPVQRPARPSGAG